MNRDNIYLLTGGGDGGVGGGGEGGGGLGGVPSNTTSARLRKSVAPSPLLRVAIMQTYNCNILRAVSTCSFFALLY